MWVTIIADASYCPETGKAGYGFWIACQRGKLGGDGVFHSNVENNIAAEMMAINNALHVGCKRGLVREGDCVLLQTDCQPAIDAFNFRRVNITQQEQSLSEWFKCFCIAKGLKVRLKHVKGHSTSNDARFVVNNICDRKARENMRKARDSYRLRKIIGFLKGDTVKPLLPKVSDNAR